MKITDSETIKNSEKELIDAITGDLDWQAIEQIFKDKYNLGLQDDLEYRQGDIVVHENKIVYKLDFDVKVNLSVLFDRKGECIEVKAGGNNEEPEDMHDEQADTGDTLQSLPDSDETMDEEKLENVSQMASQIADMITDINKE